MDNSILTSTKKILNVPADYTVFDQDIIVHINSAFSTLNQLGLGPDDGFMIDDETATWDTFIGVDNRLNAVRTYVFLRVKLLFDPPVVSVVLQALQEQIKELEWRLMVVRDGDLP